jgi:hypothetical protein
LRDDSCCSVEVVNGGAGFRRRFLLSTMTLVSSPTAATVIVF